MGNNAAGMSRDKETTNRDEARRTQDLNDPHGLVHVLAVNAFPRIHAFLAHSIVKVLPTPEIYLTASTRTARSAPKSTHITNNFNTNMKKRRLF